MDLGVPILVSDVPANRPGFIGQIPIRNIWLLMLYASEFFKQVENSKIQVEENPEDIPDLIAEILAAAVEKR